jgi:hypothetical protein
MSTQTPAAVATAITEHPVLPEGAGERFTAFAVMGQPFASGDLLAVRLIGDLSIATGYRAVWHRDAGGTWRFITTAAAHLSCPRYFGAVPGGRHERRDVQVRWPDPWHLEVTVPGELEWTIALGRSLPTRSMTAMATRLPAKAWTSPAVLAPMGAFAGPYLGIGKARLHGVTPNGQWFTAAPTRLWTVTATRASIRGRDLGAPAPLAEQAWLGDFALPQRGLAAAGHGAFESFDPQRHVSAESMSDMSM